MYTRRLRISRTVGVEVRARVIVQTNGGNMFPSWQDGPLGGQCLLRLGDPSKAAHQPIHHH